MLSTKKIKATIQSVASGLMLLLLAASASHAQVTVDLTASRNTTTLPDGNTLPMWGYTCGSTASDTVGACAKLNANSTGWSPALITVPTGQSLTVNLTNTLPTNTSIIIVGQLAEDSGRR